jgi:two-component system alkaline phosphatase synthesis response regulator PhoP
VKRKILIAEDDESILQLLSTVFSLEDYEVFCATDGEEAIRIWREDNPEVVLLDIQLPKMDGYQVCKAIKSDSTTSHVKVIMLSGMTQDYEFIKALKAGCDDFIKKPFSLTFLVEKVKELLRSEKQGEFGNGID